MRRATGRAAGSRRNRSPRRYRLTTFASWEELGRWYQDLQRPQRAPSREIRDRAAELTAGWTTDLEKIPVCMNMSPRISGMSACRSESAGISPMPRRPCCTIRTGDCKDKHTLLASLSESVGLRASAVLINSRVAIDPDFPSPSQFDHVMTKVSLGSEEVWLDATPEVAPFRLLSPSLRRKQALVVESHGRARLEGDSGNDTEAECRIGRNRLDPRRLGHPVGARSSRVQRRPGRLLVRSMFRRIPAAQWKTLLERISASAGLDGDIRDLETRRIPPRSENHSASTSG